MPPSATGAIAPAAPASRVRQYYALTKPRVVQLIVFCAMIGMLMAEPSLPDWRRFAAASAGIWLVAAAAAAFNCLVERHVDARMQRTAWRPTARGELAPREALAFSALLCAAGCALLCGEVNALTMWLTLATFVGYAVVYTIVLKPRTPQNIVIGGASGAMPPLLGWAAMRDDIAVPAVLMWLIIFLWTPPHFWSLALYRIDDYRRAGIPMLPVTHGAASTRRHIFVYTLLLFVSTLLPAAAGMSGTIYLAVALGLGISFILRSWTLLRRYTDALSRRTFRFSIVYLALLFLGLLVDHYASAWH
ncbi:heme o synthase [Scleromatobacter humisilvae]|uniref:Protoheme IX farnesyltransferase n=1 Tax=Scleromatobacter humisilvae TaxID=2897159 RepID=A0A9X2C115_9BURK|nr:heme o synthase [Scleromatobacter humisilvae]MCK9687121.1 heme o synthase [Scleromatobacter humisilvae]